MLVYFGWFGLKIQDKKFRVKDFKDVLKSLLITAIVVLPWQIFIFNKYPADAALAHSYNVQHFFKVIEGHRGSIWYHIDHFNILFGNLAPFLIIPAYYFLYKKISDTKVFYALVSMVCITYIFFSLAKTKMYGFPIVVSLLVYIPIASFLDVGMDFISKMSLSSWIKKLIVYAAICLIFLGRLDIVKIRKEHTMYNEDNSYTRMLIHNKEIFKSLHLPENVVIFNVKGQHYIESMFYTGLASYRFIPSYEQYQDMNTKGRRVAIFKPVTGDLPDYLKKDTSVIVLDQVLQGYN